MLDEESPTWEYGRYRRSMLIHLLENTVDIEKNRLKSIVDVDSY